MRIPIGVPACDTAHQQLVPIPALGSEYNGVRYRDRLQGSNESVPWTITGVASDPTVLTYDPPIAGAPTSLTSGQVVIFNAPGPFNVKSQDDKHPFSLAAHMSGGMNAGGEGDPEYVNIVAPKQYLNKYLFLTDPTYPTTNLVFVRQRAKDNSFKDVE